MNEAIILVIDGFGDVNNVRNGAGFVLNRRLLLLRLVSVDEVEVVGEGGESTPEEEAVDEPTGCVAVLLYLSTAILSKGSS